MLPQDYMAEKYSEAALSVAAKKRRAEAAPLETSMEPKAKRAQLKPQAKCAFAKSAPITLQRVGARTGEIRKVKKGQEDRKSGCSL